MSDLLERGPRYDGEEVQEYHQFSLAEISEDYRLLPTVEVGATVDSTKDALEVAFDSLTHYYGRSLRVSPKYSQDEFLRETFRIVDTLSDGPWRAAVVPNVYGINPRVDNKRVI